MIDRRQRRALTAGFDIPGSEIKYHPGLQFDRQVPARSQLTGLSGLIGPGGMMNNSLTMKSDQVEVFRFHTLH